MTLRVYHFVNREFGLDDLKRRRLKIATVSDLNDPFELLPMTLAHRDLRRAIQKFRRSFSDRYGMVCFSADWQNPVQWSHYAEKHRGLCLAFEVPREAVRAVKYVETRDSKVATEILSNGTVADAVMLDVLTTKFSHWGYEKEMRSFVELSEADENGFYFADFSNKLKLVGVIVGSQSSITREELRSALGPAYEHISVFKARLAFQSFRVVRQMDTRRWR